jgi:hypothetical protein
MFIVQFQKIQSSLIFVEKPRENRLIFDRILNYLKLGVLWERKCPCDKNNKKNNGSQIF